MGVASVRRAVRAMRGADAVAGPSVGWRGARIGSGSGGRSRRGLSSEDAAAAAGVSQAVGARWFREGGGMPSITFGPAVGALSVVRRAGGDRAPACAACSACARSRAGSVGRRRRSRGSCGATPRPAAALCEYRATTAQWHAERRAQPPEGREARGERPAARVRAGPARRAGRRARTARRCRARRCAGSVVGTDARQDRRWAGRGARSRSPSGCGSTSPMMSPCGSPTRRSTRRSTSRAAARCGASSTACLRTGRALRVPRARTRGRGKGFVTRRGHDQRAAGRGRRPGRARPLGRRPDPRPGQLRDRHARRAHAPGSRCCCTCRAWTGTAMSRASRTARRWPGTAPRPSATRSPPRSPRCPSSCADR